MKPAIAVTLLLLAWFLPGLAVPATAYYEGFTHTVYVENITATWCPTCRVDQGLISNTYQKYLGSVYFVEFHVADEWDTKYGMRKANEYQTTLTPTHAYDAGYIIKIGTVDEEKIEIAGKRAVHRVTLAILKRLHGDLMSFEGSIREEDGRQFKGKITVVVVENGLRSRGVEWNFVFRAYLLNLDINLEASSYVLFSGSWRIPTGVNWENVMLVAAAFDSSDRGDNGGPFAVQSVSDVDSGAVIPEFASFLAVAGLALMTAITALRFIRKADDKNGTRQSIPVQHIL